MIVIIQTKGGNKVFWTHFLLQRAETVLFNEGAQLYRLINVWFAVFCLLQQSVMWKPKQWFGQFISYLLIAITSLTVSVSHGRTAVTYMGSSEVNRPSMTSDACV